MGGLPLFSLSMYLFFCTFISVIFSLDYEKIFHRERFSNLSRYFCTFTFNYSRLIRSCSFSVCCWSANAHENVMTPIAQLLGECSNEKFSTEPDAQTIERCTDIRTHTDCLNDCTVEQERGSTEKSFFPSFSTHTQHIWRSIIHVEVVEDVGKF